MAVFTAQLYIRMEAVTGNWKTVEKKHTSGKCRTPRKVNVWLLLLFLLLQNFFSTKGTCNAYAGHSRSRNETKKRKIMETKAMEKHNAREDKGQTAFFLTWYS